MKNIPINKNNPIKYTVLLLLCAATSIIMKGTHIFMRNFLSDVYFLHLLVLSLLLTLFFTLIFDRKKRTKLRANLPVLLWMFYVILHTILTKKVETYYTTYIVLICLLMFVLAYFIDNQYIESIHLFIPLILIGTVETLVTVFQYFHIIHSSTQYFSITGTFENPNITAMLISLSIPAYMEIISRKRNSLRYVLIAVLIISLAALILLKCRTALIGVIIIAFIYLLKPPSDIIRNTKFYRMTVGIFIVSLLAFAFVFQYQKKSSSDGRLTIWKITAEMIREKPLTGYGYGFFNKEYNLKQAQYFNNGEKPISEKMNAGFTAMAYNEYLEHSFMGGIIGGLIYIFLLLYLIVGALKCKLKDVYPALTTYAVIGVFNFTTNSPIILFVFSLYAAIVISHYNFLNITMTNNKIVSSIYALLGLSFVLISSQKYNAQKKLTVANKMIQKENMHQAGIILDKIQSKISTSEVFFQIQSGYLLRNGKPEEALTQTQQALRYTSSPKLYLQAGQVAELTHNPTLAEHYYDIASGIEPHLFKPLMMKLQMYLNTGQFDKAKQTANQIVNMPVKIDSDKVKRYKQTAEKILIKIK